MRQHAAAGIGWIVRRETGNNVTPGSSENCVVLYDTRRQQWLLFERPLRVYVARTLETVASALHAVEHETTNGLYAAGFIAYEAAPAFDAALAVHAPGRFPLLWFGIYRGPQPITFPAAPPVDAPTIHWEPSVDEDEYQRSFHKIKQYIEAGDTYQVNYSFRLRAAFSGDPWQAFVRMIHAQGYGYGAFVTAENWAICSASPELFFQAADGVVISRPMKGTMARGLTQAEDLAQAERLARCEKNRAENLMIVDMVRNDIGRIGDIGSVAAPALFAVEKYPTLWQMTSTVRCTSQTRVTDILRALFPAASITGAPKVRTMQIIAELERAPRRIYTGTVGFLSPERRAQFNVAIRTALVDRRRNTAEYGVGGGIVWDSEKADEFQECATKARILVQTMPDFDLLETILWMPEDGYVLLDAHLKRLADSAAYFARSVDIEAVREQLDALARSLPACPHKVRLVVGQVGAPTVTARVLSPVAQPYRVRLARSPVDSGDRFLYHKTTRRRVYEQALADAPGYDDVLLWNEKQELTESCIGNVVVEFDGRLLTPPVQCGLLSGTYRAFLIEQGRVSEARIALQDLHRRSRLYLVNSVRGMWEVELCQEE